MTDRRIGHGVVQGRRHPAMRDGQQRERRLDRAGGSEMEAMGCLAVLGERMRSVPISSNKSMIGHTLTAAGAPWAFTVSIWSGCRPASSMAARIAAMIGAPSGLERACVPCRSPPTSR
jgi:hypothetical protein